MKNIFRIMSSIKERILHFVKNNGYSKSEFYRMTNITRGVLDKESGLTEVNIAKFIAAFPEVQLDWLIKGAGQVYNSPKVDSVIVSENKETYLSSNKTIPLLSIDGFQTFFEKSGTIEEKYILNRYQVPEFKQADCLVRIQGNEMSPTFSSGDLIACKLIDGQGFVQWGRVHLLWTKTNGLIIRQLQPGSTENTFKLSSGNESYPDFEVPKNEIHSLAVVLGLISLK